MTEHLDVAFARFRQVQDQLSNKRQGYSNQRHMVNTISLGRTFHQLLQIMDNGMAHLQRHREELPTAPPPPDSVQTSVDVGATSADVGPTSVEGTPKSW